MAAHVTLSPSDGNERHTMNTAQPPFRAEHIGSLLRPPALLQARDEFAAGAIDRQRLTAAENEAIRDVVKLQEEVGLKVVTDGEFRRGTYSDSFTISGISGVSVELTEDAGWVGSSHPRPPHGAAHPEGGRPHRLERSAERRRFPLSQVADDAHAEDHAARPLLHPLPRRPRQYQPRRLSGP